MSTHQHTYEKSEPRRVTMFRGEVKMTWVRRMLSAGWPADAAESMAAFMFQERRLPSWEELIETDSRRME